MSLVEVESVFHWSSSDLMCSSLIWMRPTASGPRGSFRGGSAAWTTFTIASAARAGSPNLIKVGAILWK